MTVLDVHAVTTGALGSVPTEEVVLAAAKVQWEVGFTSGGWDFSTNPAP